MSRIAIAGWGVEDRQGFLTAGCVDRHERRPTERDTDERLVEHIEAERRDRSCEPTQLIRRQRTIAPTDNPITSAVAAW